MKRPVVITLLVVALALVCLGIGAVAFFTVNGGFPTNSPFDRNNISSQVEESKTLKVDADKPLTLKITDDACDVTVTGGDVETVQVKVVKTAYDSTQARADEEVKTIEYTIEQVGDTITLSYKIPNSMNFNNNINTVDFIVTVPTETSVNVDTSFGSVAVQGVQGVVNLSNDFGDVGAKNIEGELTIQSNSGEINVEAVDAGDKNVEIKTDFGDITLEQIKAGDVSATSNSGTVTFTKVNVTKELNIQSDFGDIDLTQAMASSYDLHTNSGSITIDGAKGKLKAYTDFGNIEILNAKSVTLDVKTNSGNIEFSGSLGAGPHNVKSDFGNIDLALPTDAKLNVDLKTDFGKIKSDLPITVTLTESSSSDKDQIVGAINGGGEQLTVNTNSGGINITAIK